MLHEGYHPELCFDQLSAKAGESELREQMDTFDPDDAAYYFRGREPIAHRYEDTDGDGERDVVIVDLPANATEHWVVIVSPK